jgi:hypothetical protein
MGARYIVPLLLMRGIYCGGATVTVVGKMA